MIERRTFVLGGGGALLALAACGGAPPPPPPGPGSVTVNATAAVGANPGPDGAGRPITLTVVQLRSTAAFEAADAIAIQAPAAALGGDLVSAQEVVLAPGAGGSVTVGLDPATTAVGVIAAFRDPSGKVVKAAVPVAPTDVLTLAVSVAASGVSVAPA